MRIITGIAKGRIIKAPEGLNTRPTSDRVKESVFNIISKKIYGARVLDLFSGTGNLGLEAISRGAEVCTFVESNNLTYKTLSLNIETLGFVSNSELYKGDAFDVLGKLGKDNKKYDIIFLDPPYSLGLVESSIKKISTLMLLDKNGIIISECDEKDIISDNINDIKMYRTEKYGRTKIYFWNKEA
jgi:16S rRNA (guanine966-N2)-methyltransferase